MSILVQKFGGTSLASVERIQSAAAIIESAVQQGFKVVAVASAMGNTTDDLLSMTNGFDLSRSKRELDMLLGAGEQISASLLAMALQSRGVAAEALSGAQAGIFTDSFHGSATIKTVKTDRIHEGLDRGKVIVVTGYQGVDGHHDVTTLGRGGSDTTAVALARALKAERCDIYTDVDGVYSADPRVVHHAHKLQQIPVSKLLTLAEFGAQVMAYSSMALAAKSRLALRVRSAFAPDDPGTLIFDGNDSMPFYGVAVDSKQDVFVLRPGDSISDMERQAVLIRQLREHGVQTEIVHRIKRRPHPTGIYLSTSDRHVFESKELVSKLCRELGVLAVHKGALSKVTAVGNFSDINDTIRHVLITLMRAKISVLYWCASDDSRVSVMVQREQVAQATNIIHQSFTEGSRPGPTVFTGGLAGATRSDITVA